MLAEGLGVQSTDRQQAISWCSRAPPRGGCRVADSRQVCVVCQLRGGVCEVCGAAYFGAQSIPLSQTPGRGGAQFFFKP